MNATPPSPGYYTRIPNMIDEDERIDAYAYRVYGHYRRRAGESGVYEGGLRETAAACRMSRPIVIRSKAVLLAAGYITIQHQQRKDGRWVEAIRITDVWGDNRAHFQPPPEAAAVNILTASGQQHLPQAVNVATPESGLRSTTLPLAVNILTASGQRSGTVKNNPLKNPVKRGTSVVPGVPSVLKPPVDQMGEAVVAGDAREQDAAAAPAAMLIRSDWIGERRGTAGDGSRPSMKPVPGQRRENGKKTMRPAPPVDQYELEEPVDPGDLAAARRFLASFAGMRGYDPLDVAPVTLRTVAGFVRRVDIELAAVKIRSLITERRNGWAGPENILHFLALERTPPTLQQEVRWRPWADPNWRAPETEAAPPRVSLLDYETVVEYETALNAARATPDGPPEEPDTPAATLWRAALVELRLKVSSANYETWLKDTVGREWYEDSGQLFVAVTSSFAAEWLPKRLGSQLRETLPGLTVRFVVEAGAAAVRL